MSQKNKASRLSAVRSCRNVLHSKMITINRWKKYAENERKRRTNYLLKKKQTNLSVAECDKWSGNRENHEINIIHWFCGPCTTTKTAKKQQKPNKCFANVQQCNYWVNDFNGNIFCVVSTVLLTTNDYWLLSSFKWEIERKIHTNDKKNLLLFYVQLHLICECSLCTYKSSGKKWTKLTWNIPYCTLKHSFFAPQNIHSRNNGNEKNTNNKWKKTT